MYLCRSVFESVSSELLTKTGSLRMNGDFHLIVMQRSQTPGALECHNPNRGQFTCQSSPG